MKAQASASNCNQHGNPTINPVIWADNSWIYQSLSTNTYEFCKAFYLSPKWNNFLNIDVARQTLQSLIAAKSTNTVQQKADGAKQPEIQSVT